MNIGDYLKENYKFIGWLLIVSIFGACIVSLIIWFAAQPRDLMNFKDKLSQFTDFEIEDHADYTNYTCIGYKLTVNPEAIWVDKEKFNKDFPKNVDTLSAEYKEKLEKNCQILTKQNIPFEISYLYSNKPYHPVTGQFILRGIVKK